MENPSSADSSESISPPKSGGVEMVNWFGDISWRAAAVVKVRSVADIVEVLQDPERYPAPLRAVGSNHSTTQCAVARNGTVIEMKGMSRILEIGNGTVTVEAGALYIDVARELRKHNLQFYVNLELGNLTMGSAACCGTKDASMPGELGQASSYCAALKMVSPGGELIEFNESDAELLQAARSSYGLFGIVYEVTFRVRPLTPLRVYHESFTLGEFERRLPELIARGESMMFYEFPFQDRILVEFRNYAIGGPPVDHRLVWWVRNIFWANVIPGLSYLLTRFLPWPQLRYGLIDLCNSLMRFVMVTFLKADDTSPPDQIIRYPDQGGFTRYTFTLWAFPESNYTVVLRDYCSFCRTYYRDHQYRCNMLSVGYRIAQDQSSLFSYSYDGPVMTVDPVTTPEAGWDDFLRAFNQFCSERGGVPLFNQTKWITAEQVRKAFGQRLSKFNTYRRRYDPTDRLLNDYFRELLA